MTVQCSRWSVLLCLAGCASLVAATPGAAQTESAEPGRQQVTTFGADLEFIRSVAFSPNSSLLYVSGSRRRIGEHPVTWLSVWDTVTCTEVKRILLGSYKAEGFDAGGEGGIREHLGCVALSPDGKWLAAGVENNVKLLDTATWRGKALLRHDGWVLSLAFSPDGKRLLAGGTKSVRLWDLQAEEKASAFKALTFKGGEKALERDRRVAFSGDGKRIAFDTYDAKAIYFEVWDVGGAKAKRLYKRQDDTVVCFHPLDSNLLFGRKRLWDLEADKGLPLDPDQRDHVRVAFSTKATVKALYHSKEANSEGKVWLPKEKTPRRFIRWNGYAAGEIAVSPDGKKLVYYRGGTVTVWDLAILAEMESEKR